MSVIESIQMTRHFLQVLLTCHRSTCNILERQNTLAPSKCEAVLCCLILEVNEIHWEKINEIQAQMTKEFQENRSMP